MMSQRELLLAALVLIALSLGGCGGRSPDVTFYTLSTLPPGSSPAAAPRIALAVGPTEFPRTLSRTQIVTRSGPNQLEIDEYHRWAEPLHHGFLRAVGENLGSLLQTERVAIYPADALFPVDLRVILDVQRFDGSRDGTVTLQARWTLLTGSTNEAIAVEQFSTEKPVSDDSYDALVRAHSAAVEDLSQAIVARIRATPTP